MRARIQHILVVSTGVIWICTLLIQCAWFKGEALDPGIIKPHPIGGYEALGKRIYYPRAAREIGVEGQVTVKAFVSKDGRVTDSRISRKLNPELDRIALNAVQRTLFEPALKNGMPVDIWISIPIVFALQDWHPKSSPFTKFKLTVRPDPSYQTFAVEMQGQLSADLEWPLHFEFLLPLNVDNVWVQTGLKNKPATRIVWDESGEWLVFDVNESMVALGFNYRSLAGQTAHKFRYKFILNHPLPDWQLAVVYGNQQVHFTQDPNQVFEQADGSLRLEYNLESLEAYEPRYLELELIE